MNAKRPSRPRRAGGPARPGRPAGRSAAAKAGAARPSSRERLVQAARACLLRHGHSACSVKRIAAQAGVNHGLVHHYFGSKEGLWLALLAEEATHIRELLQQAEGGFLDGFYGPVLLRHPDRMRLATEFLGLARAMPGVATGLREHFRLNREALRNQLDLPDQESATLAFGTLFGLAIHGALDRELPVERAVQRFLALLRADANVPTNAAPRRTARGRRR